MSDKQTLENQIYDDLGAAYGLLEHCNINDSKIPLEPLAAMARATRELMEATLEPLVPNDPEIRTEETAGKTKSTGDRLFELGGDAESLAVIAGMLAAHVAGEGKEAECMLYIIEREGYRLQEAINSAWSDYERERPKGGAA